jgi:AcrR family transcriptional regulator
MKTERVNQKARTRGALVRAAAQLVRDQQPPSMAEAAERALISVATAYRYFQSADDLWFEASAAAIDLEPTLAGAEALVQAAGDDPVRRLEVLIRAVGFRMVDDQAPFRRLARAAIDQWFRDSETGRATPVREGRRRRLIGLVVEPLQDRLPDEEVRRIARALGVIVGTDSMLALIDGMGLDVNEAKDAMLDAGRWLLTGALAEVRGRAGNAAPEPVRAPTSPRVSKASRSAKGRAVRALAKRSGARRR